MSLRWLSRPAPSGADPLALLRRSGVAGRSLFLAPGGDRVAGLGEAAVLQARGPGRFDQLARDARRLLAGLRPLDEADRSTAPLLVGGFAFTEGGSRSPESPWAAFPPARLVLPEVALITRDGLSSLVAVAPDQPDAAGLRARLDALLDEAAAALRAKAPDSEPPAGLRQLASGPDEYEARVEEAIDAIARGRLTKVIVARQEVWSSGADVEPADLLDGLRDRFPGCFLFCVQPAGGPAFVGASPERLVSVTRGVVEADALAGTAPRSSDPKRDATLARELAGSDKEQREHRMVVDHLQRSLRPLVSTLESPQTPGLRRLANVQHLHTPVRGRLLNGAGALDVAGRVHPTPAVCGLPRDDALGWLEQQERLDRGWYAGGVGVVAGQGDGEFCVAIRCGLLSGRRAALFAGAGIVAGSVADREGAEVEHKLRGMREVLFRVGA